MRCAMIVQSKPAAACRSYRFWRERRRYGLYDMGKL
jgi:hypothetical protein